LLIFVLGVLAFSFYKLVVVDRMGFCYKRFWFASSKELVLKTINELMKSGRMKLDAADTSPQAYLAHHPNCCRVDWGVEGAFSRGLISFGSAEVSVSYEMKRESMSEDDKKNHQTLYYEFISNRTACGESVGYTGSTEIKPIEYKPALNK
jgi:hypothetical protein